MRFALLFALAACGTDSSAPTKRPAALTFTFTPNPVPSQISTFCQNTTGPTKVWIYTLRIENTGEVDFSASTATQTLTGPGLSSPVSLPTIGTTFLSFFGASTIPAGGMVQATLCAGVGTSFDNALLTWTLVGANGGGTFTSPTALLLP